MESVSSMDEADRDIMSADFGCPPVHIDAGRMTWCHRPRMYWTTWELSSGVGATSTEAEGVGVWTLEAEQELVDCLEPGWCKVDPSDVHYIPAIGGAWPEAGWNS